MDQQFLLDNYCYCNGEIYYLHKVRGTNNKLYNKPIGTYDNGRYRARIKSKSYLIHRVIWVMMRGAIPDGFEIHHRDQNGLNNNIDNLQCLSKSDHERIHNEHANCSS